MPRRLYIGGVNLDLPYWGRINPRVIPPTVSSPAQITTITTISRESQDRLFRDNRIAPGTSTEEPGMLDHVDPLLGAVGIIIGVARNVHPGLRVGGFLIAVGLAVLNWGSEPAGAESSSKRVVYSYGGRPE